MTTVSLNDTLLPTGFGSSYYHALRVNTEGMLTLERIEPSDTSTPAQLPPEEAFSATDPRFVFWNATPVSFSFSTNGHLRMVT